MQSRNLRLSTGLVLFTMILFGRPGVGFSQEPAVVAIVNGEAVSLEQLHAAIKVQLEAIEQQISALKQQALAKLIDNVLLQQAAKEQGISLEEYLSRDIEAISVTAGEVNEAYDRSKPQLPGVLAPEAKYRIRRSLEDNRRADALRALLQNLRRQADVRNLLIESASLNRDLAERAGPSLGNPDAPVTVVVFADFECPFCRTAAPQLRQAVESAAGRVRLVFKHFPLDSHQHALDMARAAVCAEREQMFWPFHDRLFQQETGRNAAQLAALATSMGLDPIRFNRCMASPDVQQAIEKDVALGRAAGVSGTPSIFVNKRKLTSARELEDAIQDALSRAGVASNN